MKEICLLFISCALFLSANDQETPILQTKTVAPKKTRASKKSIGEKKTSEFKKLEGANAGGGATTAGVMWWDLAVPSTRKAISFEKEPESDGENNSHTSEARIKEKNAKDDKRLGSGVFTPMSGGAGGGGGGDIAHDMDDLMDQNRMQAAQQAAQQRKTKTPLQKKHPPKKQGSLRKALKKLRALKALRGRN